MNSRGIIQSGASNIYPDVWDEYLEPIPEVSLIIVSQMQFGLFDSVKAPTTEIRNNLCIDSKLSTFHDCR